MGKISNKRIYETVTPTGSDYLIGTDAEDRNKTKNFKIQAIADFVGKNVTIGVGSLNTLTGALTLVGGDGLTITDNGSDTITISMDRPDYVESINSLIGAVDIVGSTNIVVTDNGNDTITVDTQNLAKTNEANTFVNDQTMTKNLSVGTTVFNVDSIAERVGVNTATPSKSFDVVGDTIIQGLTGDVLTLKSPSENGDNYILFTNSLDSDKGWVGYRGTSNILQIDNLIDDIDISSLTGSVKLSLGGSVKLETTATGVDVNGGVTATGAVTGSNLSGTNTGDQTSIVGITGTTAEFNTALSDGTFATSSDLLGYVTLSTAQTIIGQKIFSLDLMVNGITVGRGSTNISTNTAVGAAALFSNTTGDNNTAIGVDALAANTTGSYNIAIGGSALRSHTTGNQNTANGFSALYSNTGGWGNTAIGYQALRSTTIGLDNVALGKQSLFNIEGDENIGIGKDAGRTAVLGNKVAGSRNIFIGADTKSALSASTINEIVIGDGAEGNGSNTVTLGNNSIATTYLKGDVSVAGNFSVDGGTIQNNLGILTLASNEISLESLTGVKWLKTAVGGSLLLYHNGNSKLTTTSTGVAVTGNASFEDNGKAIFGAGNDLQIYYDNNTDRAYIKTLTNTSQLLIEAGAFLALRVGGTQNALIADNNGAVSINYSGATKISTTSLGATITGDVVADSHVTNGGTSSDFVKGDGSLDSTTYQDASEKNQANGYAPLDSGAKIPIANLPDSVVGQVEYQGTWNASTNTPTLPAASGVKGHYYVVSVGGTYQTIVYAVGDWIISNGTAWEKVDNTDAVTTVFGRLGAILANESDYSSFYPLLGTTISAGTGLTGGGDLSANRTISHADTSSQGSLNNSGGVVIQDVTLDGFGHVTGLGSIDLDGRYVQTLTGTTQTLAKFTASGNTVEDSNIVLSSGANFVDTTIGSTSGAVNQSNNLYLLATTRPQIYLTASSYTANLFNENGDIELQAQFTSPSLFYNSIFRYNGSSATNRSLVFQTEGLDRLTINQSGSAEFSSDLAVAGDTTINGGLTISVASPSIIFNETDVTANWRNRVSSGSIRFQYASDGSTYADALVIGATTSIINRDTTINGKLEIDISAITGREDILFGTISDSTPSKFGIANATTVTGEFVPTIYGYQSINRSAFQYTAFGNSAYDSNTSDPMFVFSVSNTDSSTNPLNGTLTPITQRDAFLFRTVNFDYMRIKANGDTTINGNLTTTGSGSLIRSSIIGTGNTEVNLTIERTGASTPSKWEAYIPTGSTDLRLYNAGDKVTFSTSGNLTTTGTVTATSGLSIPNGQYLYSNRASGNLSIPILGHVSGTDDVRMLTTGRFYVVNGGLTEIFGLDNSGNVDVTGGLTVQDPSIFNREISFERYAIMKDGSGNTTGVFADSIYWNGLGHNLAIAAETGKEIEFYTNGSPTVKMTIDTAGNVGIGTDDPQKTLDVRGTFAISNNSLSYWDFDRDSNGSLVISDTNTPRMTIDVSGVVKIIGGSNAFLDLDRLTSGNAARLRYATGGTDEFEAGLIGGVAGYHITDGSANPLMTIDSSGRVGIGTSSPATELQIGDYTDSTEAITIATSNNGTGRINFYDQNNTEGGSIRVVGQQLGSKMYFSNRWDTDSDKVVFDLISGNVGIGTSSPNLIGYGAGITVLSLATSTADKFSALELAGNRGAGENQNGNIDFVNNNGTATVTSRITALNGASSVLDGILTFHTRTSAGSLTERMRIDSSGNVNITGGGDIIMGIASGTGNKSGYIFSDHWNSSEENMTGIGFSSTSTLNQVLYGGGTSQGNTATTHRFYVASNNVTLGGGVEKVTIDNTGLAVTGSLTTTGTMSGRLGINVNNSSAARVGGTGVTGWWKGNAEDNFAVFSETGRSIEFFTNGTGTARMTIDVTGSVLIPGSLSKGSGSFKIDHPLEEKKDTHHLVHSFVEAPQADNIYRGKIDLSQGEATVNLDEAGRMTEGTFVLLNGNIQCFTSNESGWTAIRGKVEGNILTIEAQDAECTDTISWLVIGERIDQHMIDTQWTDENGRVITEPLKKVEPTPEEEEEEITIIENN